MTDAELSYALGQTVAFVVFAIWMTGLAVALRVTWPRL